MSRKYDVKLADITDECREKFAPTWQPKSLDDHMVQVITAAAEKDADDLAEALTSTEEHALHPLYVARLAKLLESLELPDNTTSAGGGTKTGAEPEEPEEPDPSPAELAAERAAERNWQAIVRIYRAGARAHAIARELDRFEWLHGTTDFAESVEDIIEDMRRKLRPYLRPPPGRPPRPRDRR
jgi:hypothetical protein